MQIDETTKKECSISHPAAAIEWQNGSLVFGHVANRARLLSSLRLSSIRSRLQTVDEPAQAILQDVNVSVPQGTSVVIVGPSGAGKTSLLKILAGLLQPTTGALMLSEVDWWKTSARQKQLQLRKIGMLFQKNALFDSRNCGENVAFPLRESGLADEHKVQVLVDQYLDAVGLSAAKSLMPSELSGGMQKRLGIARALALQPKLIFYDDPTAGLDPITSRRIVQLILDLRVQNQATIVTVTNEMGRARQLASGPHDQIWMVRGGQVLVNGPAQTLAQEGHPDLLAFWEGQSPQ